jgi:hypothetical protein
VDVGEVAAAHDHLLVDDAHGDLVRRLDTGVVVRRDAGGRRLDLGRREVLGNQLAHVSQVVLAGRVALGDEPHDLVVHLG